MPIGENDRIVVSHGYLYCYCPRCDEIHSVALKESDPVDGWKLRDWKETAGYGKIYEKAAGYPENPTLLEWPMMDHCVHHYKKDGTLCAWCASHYYVDTERTVNERGKYVLAPFMIYYNGYKNDGRLELRKVSEWPARFQPIVEALTR